MSGPQRHRHEFTALYYRLGPYGDQGVHVHACFAEGCDRVLIGQGRTCDGRAGTHRRMTLTEDGPKARAA